MSDIVWALVFLFLLLILIVFVNHRLMKNWRELLDRCQILIELLQQENRAMKAEGGTTAAEDPALVHRHPQALGESE